MKNREGEEVEKEKRKTYDTSIVNGKSRLTSISIRNKLVFQTFFFSNKK